jgi:hypothetical protein
VIYNHISRTTRAKLTRVGVGSSGSTACTATSCIAEVSCVAIPQPMLLAANSRHEGAAALASHGAGTCIRSPAAATAAAGAG